MRFPLFLLAFVVLAATPVVARDLSIYDKLGPLKSTSPFPDIEVTVRGFLWHHWKQHRRGYIIFTVFTLEGEPTTSHLFIEPDGDGKWHVRGVLYSIRSDRRFISDPQKKPDKHVTTRFDAVSVKWVWDRGRYIVLKDKAGEVVDSL